MGKHTVLLSSPLPAHLDEELISTQTTGFMVFDWIGSSAQQTETLVLWPRMPLEPPQTTPFLRTTYYRHCMLFLVLRICHVSLLFLALVRAVIYPRNNFSNLFFVLCLADFSLFLNIFTWLLEFFIFTWYMTNGWRWLTPLELLPVLTLFC